MKPSTCSENNFVTAHAKLIAEHNARILNEYQIAELGDERILFGIIEKATNETLRKPYNATEHQQQYFGG